MFSFLSITKSCHKTVRWQTTHSHESQQKDELKLQQPSALWLPVAIRKQTQPSWQRVGDGGPVGGKRGGALVHGMPTGQPRQAGSLGVECIDDVHVLLGGRAAL